MLLFGNTKGEKDQFDDQQTRPVTRIFYDHTAVSFIIYILFYLLYSFSFMF